VDEVLKESERLFTVEEAAEYLRYHPEYVRQLARLGELQGRRTGRGKGTWRFTKEALDTFSSPRVYPEEANGGT
jgi:excisionase family DNA binding protein